jgi:hypothetical protein
MLRVRMSRRFAVSGHMDMQRPAFLLRDQQSEELSKIACSIYARSVGATGALLAVGCLVDRGDACD